MLGLSPSDYVLRAISNVNTNDLEQTLLVSCFGFIQKTEGGKIEMLSCQLYFTKHLIPERSFMLWKELNTLHLVALVLMVNINV